MTAEVWIGLIGGPILGLITSLVVVLIWALKKAREAGAQAARDVETKRQIDAAHNKIREVIMPKIEELERAQERDTVRMENFAAVQGEMRTDLKSVLETVNRMAGAAEAPPPKRRASRGGS